MLASLQKFPRAIFNHEPRIRHLYPGSPTFSFNKNPKQFFKDNVITIGSMRDNPPSCSGQFAFDFKVIPGCLGENYYGFPIPCFQLTLAEKTANTVNAYFLPFKEGQAHSMRLSDDADFFFTNTLTGCGFGFSDEPYPEVIHFDGDTYTNETMHTLMPKGRVHTDADYNHKEYYTCAQIMGVRTAKGWIFFSQSWIMKGLDTYQQSLLEGVKCLGPFYR